MEADNGKELGTPQRVKVSLQEISMGYKNGPYADGAKRSLRKAQKAGGATAPPAG